MKGLLGLAVGFFSAGIFLLAADAFDYRGWTLMVLWYIAYLGGVAVAHINGVRRT